MTAAPSSHASYHAGMAHLGHQGPAQNVIGPLQDDEALLLYALVRTSSVRRVLEVGGLEGFSARNFLAALAEKPNAVVYTLDVNQVQVQGPRHVTIKADAAHFRPRMVDRRPVDLVFVDCHHYLATTTLLNRMLAAALLSDDAYVVIHDTGLHPREIPPGVGDWWLNRPSIDGKFLSSAAHRLAAAWLSNHSNWQRISVHDDERRPFRHGLTILQRRVRLSVPESVGVHSDTLTHYFRKNHRGAVKWYSTSEAHKADAAFESTRVS